MGPQTENGYTAIANEILEQIAKTKLSPTQHRLIYLIWRFTYGFKRKTHTMSLSFFSNGTGCDKRHIQRELKTLEERKIITQKVSKGAVRTVGFNKNYKSWVGETDNGKTDNRLFHHRTIGETVKGAIGETDNQENNILNKNLNKEEGPAKIFKFYKDNIGLITPFVSEEIYHYIDEGCEPDLVIEAMKTAISNRAVWSYARKCLDSWVAKNIKTVEQYETFKKSQQKQDKPTNRGNFNQRKYTDKDFQGFITKLEED